MMTPREPDVKSARFGEYRWVGGRASKTLCEIKVAEFRYISMVAYSVSKNNPIRESIELVRIYFVNILRHEAWNATTKPRIENRQSPQSSRSRERLSPNLLRPVHSLPTCVWSLAKYGMNQIVLPILLIGFASRNHSFQDISTRAEILL